MGQKKESKPRALLESKANNTTREVLFIMHDVNTNGFHSLSKSQRHQNTLHGLFLIENNNMHKPYYII